MRIWSLHPKYLDSKGLVALWRETLLAKNVLKGNTKGYKNHPQLNRFKETGKTLDAINHYLAEVYNEAVKRGYNFNKQKFDSGFSPVSINVTSGQMLYEKEHLLKKLKTRDPEKYKTIKNIKDFEPHPIFKVTEGEIESWEVINY
jgi:hypothetical protein